MTTVFKNGHVYTMNREMPYVSAVAVEDDKIVYVGNDEGAKAYEAGAKVVDLAGKMLIPGLIDAHCHPLMSAFVTSGILCDAEMTHDEVLKTIRAYVEAHPDNETYFGQGYPEWVFDERGPRKEELDAICPDKPLYLMSNGVHEGWCNSKTFELRNITKDTPDPIPGFSYFHRDENGEPTGHLVEAAAQLFVMEGIRWFETEQVAGVYQDIFRQYSALGVTSFGDCGTFGAFEEKAISHIAGFEERGELKQRICGCVMVEDTESVKTALDRLRDKHGKYHSDLFNVNTLKIVNDGTVESCSCAMYAPYPDGSVVEPMIQGEALYSKCREAAAEGYNLHIHAIGDKAIHETLMAAKAVREAGYFDTRIINAHTHITAPEDIPLFAKYNVLANTSSIWHYDAPENRDILGDAQYDHQFELQSILSHGARMTLGSDFPADEMGKEPLKGIQMGVTRQIYNDPEAPILESAAERLTVEQCLEAYTINAAYGMQWDDKIGSIEVGKYADLVVLEKDLNEVPVHSIMNTKVLLTMMGGKPTYVNEAFGQVF